MNQRQLTKEFNKADENNTLEPQKLSTMRHVKTWSIRQSQLKKRGGSKGEHSFLPPPPCQFVNYCTLILSTAIREGSELIPLYSVWTFKTDEVLNKNNKIWLIDFGWLDVWTKEGESIIPSCFPTSKGELRAESIVERKSCLIARA